MTEQSTPRVVAVGRGSEHSDRPVPTRGPEHDLLQVWVGRWINEGHTVAADGSPAATIITSDVYEWIPGGFFILHTAYGRIGDTGVGGTEIIGYDQASGCYRSHFFDSHGNISTHRLTHAAMSGPTRATRLVRPWCSASVAGSRPSCTSAPTMARPTCHP